MNKYVVLTGAGLIVFASLGSAEAQVRYRHGYYGGGWSQSPYYGGHRRGWNGGGALAAGLVGGALLSGILSAATSPAYGYPYAYGYGYNYAPAYYGGYYGGPVYRARYNHGPSAYDPYAASHEIRGGYRTIYRDGRRVIAY